MALPGLPVSRLVSVAISLTPPAPSVEDIDTILILGSSNIIDTTQRMRTYGDINSVAGDFGTTAPEYLASVLWFEQNPQPSSVNIGRWAKTATNALLVGGPQLNLVYTALTAINNGAFYIVVNGVPRSITGMDFTGITNLNGAASIIQAALISEGVTSAVVVWDAINEVFRVQSGTTGSASTIGFAGPPDATGSATFSVNPTAADTLVIGGTTITFVSTTPTSNQVQIGASLPVTLASLLTLLNSSSDVNLVKFHYTVVGSVLYFTAVVTGAAGNALTLSKVATAITLSGATLSGGSGTDVSGTLGLLSTSSGSYLAQGVDAETALQAVVILDNLFSQQWYGLTVLGVVDADVLAVAAYIEASSVSKHYYGVTTQEAGVLTSTDTSNIAFQLKALRYKKTAVQYSSQNPYAVVSYLARILTTDWQANNTTITLMYKQEPGIVAETISTTQADNIKNNNCNVFVNYNNNTAIIQYGQSSSGDFTDSIIGLDWLAITLQAAWYAALFDTPTKIPQTDAGMNILATVAEQTCGQAVNNGLLAPGVWNNTGFGIIKFGSFLTKGYYVFQPSVNSQPEIDRQARKSVPFQIAVKLAGAVHSVDGTIFVNA